MNITIKGSVDAAKLNDELAAALGDWCVGWTPTHNANEAIVTLSPEREGDEQLVRDTIEAHIDAAPIREHNAPIDAEIAKLEASVTQRMLRERGPRLDAVDAAIAALRSMRK